MKKTGRILLLVIWTLGLFGCGKTSEMDRTRTVDVYYLNKEETGIDSEPYKMQKQETDDQIRELLEILAMAPDDADYKATISSSFTIVSVERDEEQVILTVDEGYRNLNPTAEVLTRAALVRTITQLNGIEYVSMKVRNDPLTDRSGNPIGIMEASMFIDNAGDEINTYEKARLTLYFTDKSGTKLVEASRSVVYNTNISMEKLVVEELIKGPNNDEIFPTVNPETKVNNVTVKDGICYVNLNESFLTPMTNATSEVTIYSITNSLVELSNVNKVQISINGDTEGTFRERIPFSTIFERNLELIE
ncbi:MAG: GerMN domain-containing protein [Lachnospiraceae bacterium]|jgi:germination protein M|nr:GerMN domain-containing protein [Lachnospiraceae bacterium]